MAFVTTATDEPATSDVSAGGVDPGVGAATVETTAAATPTPAPEPTAAADVDESAGTAEAAGADEELEATTGSATTVDADAVVPEDFVPVFVSDDLTDTGAHTSATPEPVATAPAAAPPATTTPQPPPAAPSRPAIEPISTPTPVPATPQPQDDQDDQDVLDASPGGDDGDNDGDGDGRSPSASDWASLRNCESSGNYAIDTGNGYFGAYQFSQATWDWVASMVRPDLVGVVPSDAAPGDQDALAFALYDMRGAAPWPTCGRYLR